MAAVGRALPWGLLASLLVVLVAPSCSGPGSPAPGPGGDAGNAGEPDELAEAGAGGAAGSGGNQPSTAGAPGGAAGGEPQDGGAAGQAPSGVVDIAGPNGARAQVSGADLPSSNDLSITLATGYPALPDGVERVSDVYAFLPHGRAFEEPALISVPFVGASEPSLYTAEPSGSWQVVADAHVVGSSLEAHVSHFSYFFAGIASPPPAFFPVSQIAMGGGFNCALMTGGSVRCWGFSKPWHGDQIVETCGVSALPCSKQPLEIPGLSAVVALTAGNATIYAILSDGTVRGWGDNSYGQLCDGSNTRRFEPAEISAFAGAKSIAAGDFHACALFGDGSVKCCGRNDYGEVGDGTSATQRWSAVAAKVSGVSAIAAQDFATCALTNGALSCWGYNERGQLGNGGTTSSGTPSVVELGAEASGVWGSGKSSGYGFGCALLTTGSARCWGENGLGQTGKGTTSYLEASPVAVQGVSNALSLAVGGAHACALLGDHTVRCWGANIAGQLGDGTMGSQLSAKSVLGLQNVKSIAAADAQTCAIQDSGRLSCWGGNDYGRLGDGTLLARSQPVPVAW